MSKTDLLLLLAGFLAVATFITLAILFPVYRVYPDGISQPEFVRKPLWDPPLMFPGKEVDLEERVQQAREQLEASEVQLPDSFGVGMGERVRARPIFMGSKRRHPNSPRNWLGTTAVFATMVYGFFAVFKFINRG